MNFEEKHLSCYILLTDQISLSLLLEILGKMSTVIIYRPVFDVVNFEINHSFFTKLFSYKTKNLGQEYKYLKNEKSF